MRATTAARSRRFERHNASTRPSNRCSTTPTPVRLCSTQRSGRCSTRRRGLPSHVRPHLRTAGAVGPDRRHHRRVRLPEPGAAGTPRARHEHTALRQALGCALRRADLSVPAAAAVAGRAWRRGAVPGRRRRARRRLRVLYRTRTRTGLGRFEQEGRCTTPAGEVVSVPGQRSCGRRGSRPPGLRGRALGSVHHGRPRRVEDDRDAEAGVHRARPRSSSTARTCSASWSSSTRALLGGAELVGVVAETLTRGSFNVRIERVGRPEVKNMMLAPKQFDQVNRDLEIRDLYNMRGRVRPRRTATWAPTGPG